jgi:hypothetical protein
MYLILLQVRYICVDKSEMIRKTGNILVMCLLLISTTGFSVSEHFCGTRLVSIEINKEAEPCCDNGMCCHTEMHFFQLQEDFVFTALHFDFSSTFQAEVTFTEPAAWNQLYAADMEHHLFRIAESPPPDDRNDRLSSLQQYIL